MNVDQVNEVLAEADILANEAEIVRVMDELAERITAELSDSMPVVYCVMNGGLIFAGQMLTRLRFPLEVEYLHATRYGHQTWGQGLEWLARPERDLTGKTVLLLDDIFDEGVTLAAIAEFCGGRGASRVLSAVLVEKKHDRKVPGFRPDFVGLETADRFLFGFGLDYRGFWRNAPGIYAVKGL